VPDDVSVVSGWLRPTGSRMWQLVATGSRADVELALRQRTGGMRSVDVYVRDAARGDPNQDRPVSHRR
jgi:hypothetical protein